MLKMLGDNLRGRRKMILIVGAAAVLCGSAAGLAVLWGGRAVQDAGLAATSTIPADSRTQVLTPIVSPSVAPTVTAHTSPTAGPAEGGLADEALRNRVWATILSFYSNVRDCHEVVNTDIELIDAGGAQEPWVESWTVVACGEEAVLEITFTPSSSGDTRYDIVEQQ